VHLSDQLGLLLSLLWYNVMVSVMV